MTLHMFFQLPVIHGAVTGLMTAAAVDIHSFLSWKKIDDARVYQWDTAILRWMQGTVYGAIVGAGYGALIA